METGIGNIGISVVIPTLNEAANLRSVLPLVPPDAEVVLVDGRSVDDTVEVARRIRPDVVVVEQTRQGKGNALACGFAAATGDIVVMLDADGSADPREIPSFVKALLEGADFAKGSRFVEGGGSTDITGLRRLGNRALGAMVNMLFGNRFTDLCYGYNAFWRACLPVLDIYPGSVAEEKHWGDGFEIETMINIRAARAGLRITEVPSFEHPRLHGCSNLNTVADGARVFRTIGGEWKRSYIDRRRVPLDWKAVGAARVRAVVDGNTATHVVPLPRGGEPGTTDFVGHDVRWAG